MMMDGYDLTKCGFPRVLQGSKELQKCQLLRAHTIGVIGYGCPLPVVLTVNNADHYAFDSNLNVTALHLTLEANAKALMQQLKVLQQDKIAEESMSEEDIRKHREQRRAEGVDEFYCRWPTTLYIYGDSARQNKSNTFMWYCANLVR